MSLKLYEENDVQKLADAIRTKNGKTDKYKLSEMPEAVESITTGEYNIEQVIDGDECELVITTALNVGDLTITLPNDFAIANEIYWIKVNDDKYLISAKSGSVYEKSSDIGVWEYSKSSNTIIQIYNEFEKWSYFQIIDNKCLISSIGSNISYGILLYDIDSSTITKIYDSGSTWKNFQPVENGYLITGDNAGSGVLFYDTNTNTITRLFDKYAYITKFQMLGKNCLMCGTNTTYVLLYNNDDRTVQEIYTYKSTQWGSPSFKLFGEDCLILGLEILFYDNNTTTITKLYDASSAYWTVHADFENYVLISSTDSSGKGILLYNNKTKTVKQIYDVGYSYKIPHIVDNGLLISSNANYTNFGILFFNKETEEIIQLYGSGSNWTDMYKLKNGNCLISSKSNGLLIYDKELNTITSLLSSYYWKYFQEIGDNCIIALNGIYNQVTLGVYIGATKTVKILNIGGSNYDTFTEITDDSCYIESSDKQKSPYKLYYNNTDQTIKLVGLTIVEA